MCCISNIRPILCSNISFITGQTETFHFCSSFMQNKIARSLSAQEQLILLINNPLLRRTHSCRRIIYLNNYWRKETGTSYFITIHAYYLTHMEKHTTELLSSLQFFLNFWVFLFILLFLFSLLLISSGVLLLSIFYLLFSLPFFSFPFSWMILWCWSYLRRYRRW